MSLHLKWTGNGLATIVPAIKAVGGDKARTALMRAVNHTGGKTFTQVKKVLAKQVGVAQKVVATKGGLTKRLASRDVIEYQIRSRGYYLPLKLFNPLQLKKGVKASPWGRRELFDHAFIVEKLGDHVFRREHRSRLPIKKLYGPAIPEEMVKEETAKAFNTTVSTHLPGRVHHELQLITGKAFG